MKKILIIIIGCVFSLQLFSQTQLETEQWILEKLRTNIQEYEESHSLDPSNLYSTMSRHRHYKYNFYFESEYLVIEYKNRYTVSQSINSDGVEEKQIKILIPVAEINEIKKVKKVNILTSKKYVTCDQIEINTSISSMKYFNDGFEELKCKSEIINLSNESDENLPVRLQNAFTQLIKFHPKKQKAIKKEPY